MATIQSRVFVCHAQQSVYALDMVEQIVSVAERHNLSAIDSAEVIRAQTGDQSMPILSRRTAMAEKPKHQAKQAAPKQVNETRVAYATSGAEAIYASAAEWRVFADFHEVQPIVSSHVQEILFIINKPERAAHNNP